MYSIVQHNCSVHLSQYPEFIYELPNRPLPCADLTFGSWYLTRATLKRLTFSATLPDRVTYKLSLERYSGRANLKWLDGSAQYIPSPPKIVATLVGLDLRVYDPSIGQVFRLPCSDVTHLFIRHGCLHVAFADQARKPIALYVINDYEVSNVPVISSKVRSFAMADGGYLIYNFTTLGYLTKLWGFGIADHNKTVVNLSPTVQRKLKIMHMFCTKSWVHDSLMNAESWEKSPKYLARFANYSIENCQQLLVGNTSPIIVEIVRLAIFHITRSKRRTHLAITICREFNSV